MKQTSYYPSTINSIPIENQSSTDDSAKRIPKPSVSTKHLLNAAFTNSHHSDKFPMSDAVDFEEESNHDKYMDFE